MDIKRITLKGKRALLEMSQGAPLDLHIEAYVEGTYHEGMTLTPKAIQTAQMRSQFYEASESAFKALSHKPYTHKAMRDKLSIKYPVHTVEQVLVMLKQHRYLDDESLLQSRLDDALNFELKGPKHYQQAWQRHGFKADMIATALESVSEDRWLERCEALLLQTVKTSKPLTQNALKQRMYQTALRSGYSGAIIDSALRQVTLEQVDETSLIQEELKRIKGRYDVTVPKEKQALIQRLLRQGFAYETIKKHLG